jgi:hypothetical protein
LAAKGIDDENVLEELEGHLREAVAQQVKAGVDAQQAFDIAVEGIGQVSALRSEFRKVAVPNWRRRLAHTAWAIFIVSFFLPSYDNGPGWKCAILQGYFWEGVTQGQWGSIHYELLTLANLLMLASPWLVFKFGGSPRVVKWFRALTLGASILVWSFIGLLLASDRSALKVGCFVWGISFVVIHLSTYSFSFRNKIYATA